MHCFIHEMADVQSSSVGDFTKIWQFCVVCKDAVIGANCNICAGVFIENDVIIGNNVTIKSGVQIWDGIRIEDDVFIGPNVTFTNDLIPRSKQYPETFCKTILKKGCSIGANATIIAGVSIGEYSLIGAGSVVTKDVPPNTVWYGNPAKFVKYISNNGKMYNDKNNMENELINTTSGGVNNYISTTYIGVSNWQELYGEK